jgi:hypothetical protein
MKEKAVELITDHSCMKVKVAAEVIYILCRPRAVSHARVYTNAMVHVLRRKAPPFPPELRKLSIGRGLRKSCRSTKASSFLPLPANQDLKSARYNPQSNHRLETHINKTEQELNQAMSPARTLRLITTAHQTHQPGCWTISVAKPGTHIKSSLDQRP